MEQPYEAGPVRAIGLMSGTSIDGVDAALIETDGITVSARGAALSRPYPEAFRDRLRRLLGRDIGQEDLADQETASVVQQLTEAHAAAVAELLDRVGLSPSDVHVLGFHGQTVFHDPDAGITRQIGDGSLLSETTGIDTVFDFRSADVSAGGEGAPLACAYHRALAGPLDKPLAVLNLGGVGNVTWLGPDERILAFDTGPANALLDDWCSSVAGTPFDQGGALAAAGTADAALVERWLARPYFTKPVPKSLDRDAFKDCWPEGLSPADGAATLAAFTCASVARALQHLPDTPQRWLVTGGGRHNPVLMQGLRDRLGVPVEPVEAEGWDGDHLEAQAFAYLAVRSLAGLPLSFPGTTGVGRPLTGGRVCRVAA